MSKRKSRYTYAELKYVRFNQRRNSFLKAAIETNFIKQYSRRNEKSKNEKVRQHIDYYRNYLENVV